MKTFQGYPILKEVEKAEPGTDRYTELTKHAAEWRAFSLTTLGTGVDENVSRELEIERDHGLVVAINPRC